MFSNKNKGRKNSAGATPHRDGKARASPIPLARPRRRPYIPGMPPASVSVFMHMSLHCICTTFTGCVCVHMLISCYCTRVTDHVCTSSPLPVFVQLWPSTYIYVSLMPHVHICEIHGRVPGGWVVAIWSSKWALQPDPPQARKGAKTPASFCGGSLQAAFPLPNSWIPL